MNEESFKDKIYELIKNSPLLLIRGNCRFSPNIEDWEVCNSKEQVDGFHHFLIEQEPRIIFSLDDKLIGDLFIKPRMVDNATFDPNDAHFNMILVLTDLNRDDITITIKINNDEFPYSSGLGEFVASIPVNS